MAAKVLDLASYDRLLTEFHPQVPQTEEENERLLGIIRGLMRKKKRSPEEQALIRLLTVLIENFEESHYPVAKAEPDEVLRELMRSHDTKPKDLYEIFGSKGTTSEVLRGKRGISKNAAKSLSKLFGVSVDLFL